jgi:hypothetical protein
MLQNGLRTEADAIFNNFGLSHLIRERSLYTNMIRHQCLTFHQRWSREYDDTVPAPEWNVSEKILKSCGLLWFVRHERSAERDTSSDVLPTSLRTWSDRIVVREANTLG